MADAFIKYSDLIQDDGAIQKMKQDVQELEKFLTDTGKRLEGKLNIVNVKDTEAIKKLSKEVKLLGDAKEEVAKANDLVEKTAQQSIKTKQQEQRLLQENQKTEQQGIKTKQQTHRLRVQELREVERLAKASKRLANQKRKENSLYHQQSARLNDLRKRFKDVTLAEGRFSAKSKSLGRELRMLDKQLKAVDARAGQFQRNVGNYPKVVGAATRVLGQLGIAMGGIALLRSSVDILVDFDEGLADIAKTANITIAAAKEISQALLLIDTKSTITELQALATAAGRLGIEGKQNIIDFVEAADKAFVALGDDLSGTADEIATSMGKISSLFGFEEEFGVGEGILRVSSGINELAANSKAAAEPILDFTNRLAGLSETLELSEVQALGALFDESGQSIEVAASTIQKILPAIGKDVKAFAKVAGLTTKEFQKIVDTSPFEALLKVAEGAKTSRKGLTGLAITMQRFGIDSARASNVLNILSNNTERLIELNVISKDALESNASVTDEFNLKNETLGATIQKLKNEFTRLILGTEGATGASQKLVAVFKFLTKNLGTIFKLVKAAAIGWLAYKTALLVVNKETQTFKSFGILKFLKQLLLGIKGLITGTKGAAGGFKALGASMKTIPLLGIISGIATIVSLLWDFGEAVDHAALAQDRFNKALERGNEIGNETIKVINARIDEFERELDIQVRLEKVSKKEAAKLRVENIQNEISALEESNKNLQESIDLQKERNNIKGVQATLAPQGDPTGQATIGISETDAAFIAQEAANSPIFGSVELQGRLDAQVLALESLKRQEEELTTVRSEGAQENLKSKKKDLTELQKLQAELKKINTLRANDLIINKGVETALFNELTGEAKLLDAKIKRYLEQLKLGDKANESLAEEIALINAQIEAEDRRSTGINTLKIQSIQREIDLYNKELEALEKIIDAGEETEQQLIDFNKIQLSRNDAEQELNRLSFGRLDNSQIERDLIRDTARIRLKFIEDEVSILQEKITLNKFDEESQLALNKLLLERKKLTQDIRDANFEESQETLLKAEEDRQIEFQQAKLDGAFDTNEKLIAAERKLQEDLLKLRIQGLKNQLGLYDDQSLEYKKMQNEILGLQQELFDLNNVDASKGIEKWKDFVDTLRDVFSQVLDRLEALRQKDVKSAEKAITDQDKLVDEQRKRAEEGKTNTLAFEQKQRAKREAELIKSQKRLERIQKIQTFYASYQANLGALQEGEDSSKALLKTLRDQAIAEAIVATFGDGGVVEDNLPRDGIFRGQSHKGNRGGIPILVEGQEGILSKNEMGNLGKQNFYDLKAMAGSGVIGQNFFKGQSEKFRERVTVINSNGKLEQEMREVKKAIANIEIPKIDMFRIVNGVIKWRETVTKGRGSVVNNYRVNKGRF